MSDAAMVPSTIVLAGGDPVSADLKALLPDARFVIAADSGVHAAEVLGLHVDVVVGDLDSADPDAVERAVAAGATVERYSPHKDATDLELALEAAAAHGAADVCVVGGAGGRLDHLLANLALLASPRFAHLRITALVGEARLTVITDEAALRGVPGGLVTLVPLGGAAQGVTTEGLEYPLHDDDLDAGTTRGVSNVFLAETATVRVGRGIVLAVQP
jgi:thiamine pyrophosphokinase